MRIRERLFGLTQTVARRLLAPCAKAFRTFSAYFALPVCLLRNSHLLTLDQPFTPYVLQTTSPLGRPEVIFNLFRSHLRGLPKSPYPCKVTWERAEGDSSSYGRNVRNDPKGRQEQDTWVIRLLPCTTEEKAFNVITDDNMAYLLCHFVVDCVLALNLQ